MATVISLEHVEKQYETVKGKIVEAVKDVTLDLREKEVMGLVGPSGCGKSTLLRIIAGLEKPTSGTIERSEVLSTQALGFIFQDSSLMKWRSVYDNIKLPLEVLHRVDPKQIEKVIEMVNLKGFEKAFPYELSGGMQRRVAIGRAIVHSPKALIMDEPFTGVDEITKESLQADLNFLIRELGVTGVLVTHNIEEAVYLSDRVFVLSPSPGTIIAEVVIPLKPIREPADRVSDDFIRCCKVIREKLNLLHPLRTRSAAT